jgi:lipopolysaccharide export system protein LptC
MRLALRGTGFPARRPDTVGGRSAVALADTDYRRSRRVALLRRLLPALGLGLLLLIATWPRLAPLWERIRTGFPAIDLRDAQELRMINPRYTGVDRRGRPFVVTAAVGRQVPKHQDLMSLQKPHADLKTNGGADITLIARTGIYQQQTQLLDLFGNVTLVHQNGTRFVTDRARVNGARETAEGDDPVAGQGPSGRIKAQGFRVLDKGDTILFTGRADALLKSAPRSAKAPAPAVLPAPVARAAAEAGAAMAHERAAAHRHASAHRHRAHSRHRASHARGRR